MRVPRTAEVPHSRTLSELLPTAAGPGLTQRILLVVLVSQYGIRSVRQAEGETSV